MTSQRKQTAVAALLVLALLLALPQVARADDTDISDPVLSEAQCAIVEDSAGNVLYERGHTDAHGVHHEGHDGHGCPRLRH